MAKLPTSMKALVLKGPGNGAIEDTPVTQAVPGSVIVCVLHVLVYQITLDVFHGTLANPNMTLPFPLVFGSPYWPCCRYWTRHYCIQAGTARARRQQPAGP